MHSASAPFRARDHMTDTSPPRLLDQRPAIFWMRRAFWWSMVSIGVTVCMVASLLLAPPSMRLALFDLFALVGLTDGVVLIVIGLRLSRASWRERRANYTTLYIGGKDVWLLDWRTGSVVRPPLRPRG